MPHAGSIHHDTPQEATADQAPSPPAPSRTERRWPVGAIALGGALTLGAVAAAVALVRGGGSKPKGKRGKGGKKRRNARR